MWKRAFYLFVAVGLGGSAMRGGPIHLKTRDLTRATYSAAQAQSQVNQGPGHWLVQFSAIPSADTLQELERRGAHVVAAAPDGGLTIALKRPTSLAGLGIEWAGPLLPQDKISPLLSSAAAVPSAVLVEFHPDVNPRLARALLRNVHVLTHPDLAPNHFLISAPPQAWADLAKLDPVAYIFPAAAELIQHARVIPCSGAFTAQGPVGQYVTVGSGWTGAGPDGVVELDYFFTQMSAKLPAAAAQTEIIRALQEWAKYTNIRFIPGTSAIADHTVAIMFARGAHGDPYPFTPGSYILAHTFFPAPPNPEPLAGDMHLNDDQNWHIGTDIDLYTVALHEAGHALGLGHTDDPTAVMYPYYRFGATLSDNDIAGVQSLYGSPDTAGTPVIPPVMPPVIPPQPPVPLRVAILNPAQPVTTTSSSIALSGTATGGTGALQVSWSNDQGGGGQAVGTTNWTIASVPLATALNTITVRVADVAGAGAAASVAVTRQSPSPPPDQPPAPPASGPPSLSIVSPSLSIVSTSLAAITLAGTASASVTSVTWTSSTGGSGNAAGTTSWTAAGIPLLVGNNTITVRAFNAANQSAWRSITVVRQ